MASSVSPLSVAQVTCQQAAPLLARFLGGGLGTARQAQLRAHLRACKECREDYEQGVRVTASVGAELRHERHEVDRQVRHLRLRRRALNQQNPRALRRRKLSRMRTLVYPAFFALLIWTVSTGAFGSRATLLAETGQVEVDGHALAHVDGPAPLRVGKLCATGPAGRARLEAPGAEARLAGATHVRLESTRDLRLLLQVGRLDLKGELTVATSLGVLTLGGGAAHIERDVDGVRIEVGSGQARWVDASGPVDLARGERLER